MRQWELGYKVTIINILKVENSFNSSNIKVTEKACEKVVIDKTKH